MKTFLLILKNLHITALWYVLQFPQFLLARTRSNRKLNKFNSGDKSQIDVTILPDSNIEIVYDDDLLKTLAPVSGVVGAARFIDGSPIIIFASIVKTYSREAQDYAMAHELGHLTLHQEFISIDKWRPFNLKESKRLMDVAEHRNLEEEADDEANIIMYRSGVNQFIAQKQFTKESENISLTFADKLFLSLCGRKVFSQHFENSNR